MPRYEPTDPEHNVVQNPELLGRLRDLLGLRQRHIAPTMGEVLTPVAIVADISKELPSFPVDRDFVCVAVASALGALNTAIVLTNPPPSNVNLRLTRYRLATDDNASIPRRVQMFKDTAGNAAVLGGALVAPTFSGYGARESTTRRASTLVVRAIQRAGYQPVPSDVGHLVVIGVGPGCIAPNADYETDLVITPGDWLGWEMIDAPTAGTNLVLSAFLQVEQIQT